MSLNFKIQHIAVFFILIVVWIVATSIKNKFPYIADKLKDKGLLKINPIIDDGDIARSYIDLYDNKKNRNTGFDPDIDTYKIHYPSTIENNSFWAIDVYLKELPPAESKCMLTISIYFNKEKEEKNSCFDLCYIFSISESRLKCPDKDLDEKIKNKIISSRNAIRFYIPLKSLKKEKILLSEMGLHTVKLLKWDTQMQVFAIKDYLNIGPLATDTVVNVKNTQEKQVLRSNYY